MPAADETECLRETAAPRRVSGRSAQMPLANPTSHIAGVLEELRQQSLRQRQSLLRIQRIIDWIKLVPEPLLVAPGQQRRARGAAKGVRDIAAGAAHTGLRQPVEVRGRDARWSR